jgi:hypothetical protein
MKQKLKIILTDGNYKKKILWLYINDKNEPIFGHGYKKFVNRIEQDFHFTIHNDGNQSYRFYGDKKIHQKAYPVWNGNGIRHLHSLIISADVKEESLWLDYKTEKNDVLLEIDNKEYVENNHRILLDIYQLEPNQTEFIKNIHSGKPPNPKIHIFDTFTPWLVVCVYKHNSCPER